MIWLAFLVNDVLEGEHWIFTFKINDVLFSSCVVYPFG
ncbi:hypothetical protein PRUB_b1493 [Pseudoalteromonas rubra]|uniref:Uncharacterized protein n=1 Tax=Pseudoalteromonas rubra TaxID=43658 RepID=A0A8T0C2I4_9GAMM|nr:hypothetical protein PRUB_b1493 [Pseudoalteromonas rubra]